MEQPQPSPQSNSSFIHQIKNFVNTVRDQWTPKNTPNKPRITGSTTSSNSTTNHHPAGDPVNHKTTTNHLNGEDHQTTPDTTHQPSAAATTSKKPPASENHLPLAKTHSDPNLPIFRPPLTPLINSLPPLSIPTPGDLYRYGSPRAYPSDQNNGYYYQLAYSHIWKKLTTNEQLTPDEYNYVCAQLRERVAAPAQYLLPPAGKQQLQPTPVRVPPVYVEAVGPGYSFPTSARSSGFIPPSGFISATAVAEARGLPSAPSMQYLQGDILRETVLHREVNTGGLRRRRKKKITGQNTDQKPATKRKHIYSDDEEKEEDEENIRTKRRQKTTAESKIPSTKKKDKRKRRGASEEGSSGSNDIINKHKKKKKTSLKQSPKKKDSKYDAPDVLLSDDSNDKPPPNLSLIKSSKKNDIPKDKSKDIQKDIQKDISKDIPKDKSKDISKDKSKDTIKGFTPAKDSKVLEIPDTPYTISGFTPASENPKKTVPSSSNHSPKKDTKTETKKQLPPSEKTASSTVRAEGLTISGWTPTLSGEKSQESVQKKTEIKPISITGFTPAPVAADKTSTTVKITEETKKETSKPKDLSTDILSIKKDEKQIDTKIPSSFIKKDSDIKPESKKEPEKIISIKGFAPSETPKIDSDKKPKEIKEVPKKESTDKTSVITGFTPSSLSSNKPLDFGLSKLSAEPGNTIKGFQPNTPKEPEKPSASNSSLPISKEPNPPITGFSISKESTPSITGFSAISKEPNPPITGFSISKESTPSITGFSAHSKEPEKSSTSISSFPNLPKEPNPSITGLSAFSKEPNPAITGLSAFSKEPNYTIKGFSKEPEKSSTTITATVKEPEKVSSLNFTAKEPISVFSMKSSTTIKEPEKPSLSTQTTNPKDTEKPSFLFSSLSDKPGFSFQSKEAGTLSQTTKEPEKGSSTSLPHTSVLSGFPSSKEPLSGTVSSSFPPNPINTTESGSKPSFSITTGFPSFVKEDSEKPKPVISITADIKKDTDKPFQPASFTNVPPGSSTTTDPLKKDLFQFLDTTKKDTTSIDKPNPNPLSQGPSLQSGFKLSGTDIATKSMFSTAPLTTPATTNTIISLDTSKPLYSFNNPPKDIGTSANPIVLGDQTTASKDSDILKKPNPNIFGFTNMDKPVGLGDMGVNITKTATHEPTTAFPASTNTMDATLPNPLRTSLPPFVSQPTAAAPTFPWQDPKNIVTSFDKKKQDSPQIAPSPFSFGIRKDPSITTSAFPNSMAGLPTQPTPAPTPAPTPLPAGSGFPSITGGFPPPTFVGQPTVNPATNTIPSSTLHQPPSQPQPQPQHQPQMQPQQLPQHQPHSFSWNPPSMAFSNFPGMMGNAPQAQPQTPQHLPPIPQSTPFQFNMNAPETNMTPAALQNPVFTFGPNSANGNPGQRPPPKKYRNKNKRTSGM